MDSILKGLKANSPASHAAVRKVLKERNPEGVEHNAPKRSAVVELYVS